jgi:hypothetical protein
MIEAKGLPCFRVRQTDRFRVNHAAAEHDRNGRTDVIARAGFGLHQFVESLFRGNSLGQTRRARHDRESGDSKKRAKICSRSHI